MELAVAKDPHNFYFGTFIVFTGFCVIGLFNVVTGLGGKSGKGVDHVLKTKSAEEQ